MHSTKKNQVQTEHTMGMYHQSVNLIYRMCITDLLYFKTLVAVLYLPLSFSCSSNDFSNNHNADFETSDVLFETTAGTADPITNDFTAAATLQSESVNTDIQTTLNTNSPSPSESPTTTPSSPPPSSGTSTQHTFTLDLSQQSIGRVDLIISLDNSAYIAPHIRKFENVFKSFLNNTTATIHSLNTTIMSCIQSTLVTDEACLNTSPSPNTNFSADVYAINKSMNSHTGFHWLKNIIKDTALFFHNHRIDEDITIARNQVLTQNHKKVFLDISNDNDVDTSKFELEDITPQIDGLQNFSFYGFTHLKTDGQQGELHCSDTCNPYLQQLARQTQGKLYSIYADDYSEHFTDLTKRIDQFSWATVDISSLSSSQISRIAQVEMNGRTYKHKIKPSSPSTLLVDLPANTTDETTITVIVAD